MERNYRIISILFFIVAFCSVLDSYGQKPLKKPVQTIKHTNVQKEKVSVLPVPYKDEQHDYVDLGLSVKWASTNLGASAPEQSGCFFAWGEISPKKIYSERNCKTLGLSTNDIAANPLYDAVYANWGKEWRLPTGEEIDELIDNCSCIWTNYKGVEGYLFKSKKNEKSIFFPACGNRDQAELYGFGKIGRYWISTPHEKYEDYAYGFYFDKENIGKEWNYRSYGHCIRPVHE